jgi:hypothetical protein
MTTLQVNEPLTATTALTAEREREKGASVQAARLTAQTIQRAIGKPRISA